MENPESGDIIEKPEENQTSTESPENPVELKPKKGKHLAIWLGSAGLVVVLGLGFLFKDSLFGGSINPDNGTVEGVESQAVAVVNGKSISRKSFDVRFSVVTGQLGSQPVSPEQVNDEANSQVKSQVLDDLINSELLFQAAGLDGFVASAEEVENQYQNILAQARGEEALQARLAVNGISLDFLRQDLAEQITIQKYLNEQLKGQDFAVTEEEVKQSYYQAASTNQGLPPLDEVRDQVESSLVNQKKNSAITAHINTLRQNAEIEILF